MNARSKFAGSLALAWLMVLFALGASTEALGEQVGPYYETTFNEPSDISAWTVSSGQWEVTNGRFAHDSSGSSEIAIVHTYQTPELTPVPVMDANYAIDVYAAVRSTASAARAGVVFNFSDPGNYYVLLFSAAGDVRLSSVIGGATIPIASGSFNALGVGKWTHIRIVRSHNTTSVQMDGKPVIASAQQAGLLDGDVGLIAHRAAASFDDFSVVTADAVPTQFFFVNPGYLEDFGDRVADRWQAESGSWQVTDGEYRSTDGGRTAITLSAIPELLSVVMSDRFAHYTVKTRMLNRYRGSGNLVGLVLAYQDTRNYQEIVFSPTGEAKINTVTNGVTSTVAHGTYVGGGQNKWFDVEVYYIESENFTTAQASVTVNGRSVFDAVTLPHSRATVGFVTHWALASFDDVRAAIPKFTPYVDDFENETPINFGDWEIANGTLHTETVSQTRMFQLPVWRDFMDIDFRAWMANSYGNAGNLVGLAYGVRFDPDESARWNYFEVVFTPTGIARLNRVLKGQTTTIATAHYAGGGAHRWFNVRLLHRQSYTTVQVNGSTIFDNVYQPDAWMGSPGVVTHWSLASFDDISVKQLPR